MGVQRLRERIPSQPAVLASQQRELRPAREESRRTTLVGRDVRLFVGEDRAVRRAQCGEAQGVGGGAGRDCEGPHLGVKKRAQDSVERILHNIEEGFKSRKRPSATA